MHTDVWARAIVEQNQRWLMAYFLSSTGNRHHAEDLVQEVFAIVLENSAKFDPSRSFGAWVRGIARNVLLQYYKQHKRSALVLDEAALEQLDCAAEQAEACYAAPGFGVSRLDALKACLSSLTDRARAILHLRYSAEKSSREIADEIGMNASAVDMMLSRARKSLEACIAQKLKAANHG
ncbi:MAG TPA: sigma-70 family RNA polymerase sigma factor [Planctomycetota bacterium]|nr:sigma-70 family RNA polymerase sigma factor [Planctomycetota bacterium]